MRPFRKLEGRVAPLLRHDVDTDQIIPAAYLKGTTRHGLGEGLFAGWRYGPDGEPDPDFVLNQPAYDGADVLLVGDNFGCGSSREHAPWALLDHGFRAIIGIGFADIFRNNALKNGLVPVAVDAKSVRRLAETVRREPESRVVIDLPTQSLILPDGQTLQFPIDPFSKSCLLEGVDQLGYLLQREPEIVAYERATGK